MSAPDWMIQPRTNGLVRAFDPVRFWSQLTVVERHNVLDVAPGTWQVTARNEGLDGLLTPGNGVILFRNGQEIMSGPITSIARGETVSTVSGLADTDLPNDRILYPDPARAITAQTKAYDNRSGPAEDVLLDYLAANMGATALTGRRLVKLRLPTSGHRGANVSITGRLAQMGTTLADVAESGGLHFEILHGEDDQGPFLGVVVRPVVDRSADVRFGTTGSFTGGVIGEGWAYTLNRPKVTAAIVAGGGELVDRTFVERTNPEAESLWGARIEQLIDQRQTTDPAELTQAGDDALADGAEPVNVSFTITDSPDVQYRRDWFSGDIVGASVDGNDFVAPVREVTTTVAKASGGPTENISAVVGSRNASAWTTKTNADIARALRELALLKAT
jgi:hypothetical protein